MKDFNIINLNQLTWQLNITVYSAVFSVFSLIYNDHYIYYGFVTFVFGILGHIFFMFFDWLFKINENHKYVEEKYYWIAHFVNVLLFISWIIVLLKIY